MKKLLYILIFMVFATNVTAETFLLGGSKIREEYFFIQLNYGTKEGKPFAEIFSNFKRFENTIAIRILGEFSEETNDELISFYKKEIPSELESALRSSGNLHNPTLRPLINIFPSAFKSTTMYKEIENELIKSGYKGTTIEFEKYIINTKKKSRIWVADIWLTFSKATNKANSADAKSRAAD